MKNITYPINFFNIFMELKILTKCGPNSKSITLLGISIFFRIKLVKVGKNFKNNHEMLMIV